MGGVLYGVWVYRGSGKESRVREINEWYWWCRKREGYVIKLLMLRVMGSNNGYK